VFWYTNFESATSWDFSSQAIRKVPAVIETPEGDLSEYVKMFLSHSYDHRVVDGALGGGFVKRVAEYLEAFDVNRDL
jgi:2-oxoglutarate dehydrogenase E2 component (dihydrolipoamide succinyltransferase)